MRHWRNLRVPLRVSRQELRPGAFDLSIRPPVRRQSTDFSSAPANFVFSGGPPPLLSLCSSFSHQDRMREFLRLKPLTFAGSSNPLDADDWLRTVKRKLETIGCPENQRVHLAAHQLSGMALS
jgi:hypothetical protein